MLGPVLQAFGTKAQKEKFLPRILSGEDFWCQGYTESHAGSDLASLKTYAQKSGNHYIVNGHKIWTTMGHFADWIFLSCAHPSRQKTPRRDFLSSH